MGHILKNVTFLPYLFVLMNCAVIAGLYQFVRGIDGIWEVNGSRRNAR
jgi:Flp pilus assembly pilin Flp